mmetsp:Transcript_40001/g.64036  ORF Transcript_40001/g.64036 Transcript_40001/m.64036 type:complete len:90 (+) Transcript_40001:116-385(+)
MNRRQRQTEPQKRHWKIPETNIKPNEKLKLTLNCLRVREKAHRVQERAKYCMACMRHEKKARQIQETTKYSMRLEEHFQMQSPNSCSVQ